MSTATIINPSATGATTLGTVTVDTITGSVSIDSPIEIANDIGNPIPVQGSVRANTISLLDVNTSNTISSIVNLSNTAMLGFISPTAWTASTLKLQGSVDGSTFGDIYGSDGAQVSSWSTITANTAYSIDVASMLPYRYVRFVTGTAQAANRSFNVITRTLA